MAAIASLDDFTTKLTGGNNGTPEVIFVHKDDRAGASALPAANLGRITSLWTQNSIPGGTGAAPGGTPRICTSATAGAIPFTNAGGIREKWLLAASINCLTPGTLILYDRLADVSGFDSTVLTAQTCAGLTPTRNTAGFHTQLWIELYAAIGSATTAVASYTNETPTSGRTTPAAVFGGSLAAEAQRILPLSLQAGDFGVTDVASLTVATSTGTAGNVGLTLAHPLLMIPSAIIGTSAIRDLLINLPSIVRIDASACLAWAWIGNTANNAHFTGHLSMVEA